MSWKIRLQGLKAVFRRELRIVVKDVNIISVILLAPLVYPILYGSIYTHKIETNVPIVVVDEDRSDLSRTLTRYADAHQLIAVQKVVGDINEAKDLLYRLEAEAIIYIPSGFEASLKSGQGTDIKIMLNNSRFLVSNDINRAFTEVTETIGAGVRLKYYESKGLSVEQAKTQIEPVAIDMRPLFNFIESYGDFLVPGLLVLIIQQTLLMGVAESLAAERERGTLIDLFQTANRSIWTSIHGKGLLYLMLFSAYTFFYFVVHFTFYKLNFTGSISALSLLTVLFLLAVVYLALFLSSFFHSKLIALQVIVFTSYPLFLLSGYSWPVQAMPMPLQILAQCLPITPYLHAFIRITQMGAGWQHIWPECIQLLILAGLGYALCHVRVRHLIMNTVLGDSKLHPSS